LLLSLLKGMDFLSNWAEGILTRHEKQLREQSREDDSEQMDETQESYRSQDELWDEGEEDEGGQEDSSARKPAII